MASRSPAFDREAFRKISATAGSSSAVASRTAIVLIASVSTARPRTEASTTRVRSPRATSPGGGVLPGRTRRPGGMSYPTGTLVDMSALDRFSEPTRAWFTGAFLQPTAAQEGAWDAVSSGEHALVVA